MINIPGQLAIRTISGRNGEQSAAEDAHFGMPPPSLTKAHRYEPDINPSHRDLAEHYSVAVLPARSRKPKDKSKVEVGVQVVE